MLIKAFDYQGSTCKIAVINDKWKYFIFLLAVYEVSQSVKTSLFYSMGFRF